MIGVLVAAGCGRPPPPTRPATCEELDSPTILGVRLGMTRDALAARMRAAKIAYDELESGLAHPNETRVYHQTLVPALNEGLILARYVLSEGKVVGIELAYPGRDLDRVTVLLIARWGPGRDRGLLGYTWKGKAANANLRPGVNPKRCKLVINRLYTGGYKPRPLGGARSPKPLKSLMTCARRVTTPLPFEGQHLEVESYVTNAFQWNHYFPEYRRDWLVGRRSGTRRTKA